MLEPSNTTRTLELAGQRYPLRKSVALRRSCERRAEVTWRTEPVSAKKDALVKTVPSFNGMLKRITNSLVRATSPSPS